MILNSPVCLRMLDYSLRGSSPLPYHLSFMVGLAEELPSSMVSESRSWVQFPPAAYFFSVAHNNSHLPCYLLSTHMA
jgi:hypothetical protein